ncbi:putative 30S ribosomal protein S18 [Ectocarpus siliculosus]|uniref:30S ribosomal protein S18 n=1 Tax=Ectocarpus siliculosus TaxID=2880 RepID=D7G2B0_ECTSI|nr:putative 30S ribosomal protein S18 [Ectocarpus siliculosus]|eukprot:CBJ48787.1 putative 30S ribosomal protein S18 [Ectocarpus siliculosus]
MFGTVRAGARSAACSTSRAGRPSRPAASSSMFAAPLRLGLLPPHPRSVRGVCHLPRRSATAASHRVVARGTRPFHGVSGRARGVEGGEGLDWGQAAAAAGNEGDSSSSSSSSDSSDDDNEGQDDDAPAGDDTKSGGEKQAKEGGRSSSSSRSPRQATTDPRAARRGAAERVGSIAGGARESRDAAAATATAAATSSAKSRETAASNGGAGGAAIEEEAEDDDGEYDYRSIGSEVYEGGDLEAGETIRGMYDFVDDIVETQHVPTIQDPFDHRGRFHRCPGKKQGKAALPSTCQIFDVKELHVNHTPLLKRFVNDAGMILGRYRTGLCAKCQRKVAHTVKAARQMGLVPTVSDYEVRDTGPGGLYAWAGKDGDHDAMAKAKVAAEMARKKSETKKRFGSLA